MKTLFLSVFENVAIVTNALETFKEKHRPGVSHATSTGPSHLDSGRTLIVSHEE
jgi:hypothetical protein